MQEQEKDMEFDVFHDSFEVKTEFSKEEFEKTIIPGNGYCMVNSVIPSCVSPTRT